MKAKKRLQKQKNYAATFFLIIILWVSLAFIIYTLPPKAFGVLPAFFTILFLALLFTLSVLLTNTRRGFMSSAAITLILLLRYFHIGNVINILLLIGAFIAFEYYLSPKS